MTAVCASFLNIGGAWILETENEKLLTEISAIKGTILRLEEGSTKDTIDKVRRLQSVSRTLKISC